MKYGKGFVVTGILYTLLLLFLILLVTGMSHLDQKQTLLRQLKNEVQDRLDPANTVPLTFLLKKETLYRGVAEKLEELLGVYRQEDEITEQVKVEVLDDGNYNYNQEGLYEITYQVTNRGKKQVVSKVIQVIPLIYTYEYVGDSQTFTVPYDGVYQIELWGASGINDYYNGGYVSGRISLKKERQLYVYVGNVATNYVGGYNGGGNSTNSLSVGGSGATDIRLVSGNWNNVTGLCSRIMVAGAGSGSNGSAGGLSGYTGFVSGYTPYQGIGGTQTSGGVAPQRYTRDYCTATAGTAGSFGLGGLGGKDQDSGAKGSRGGGGGYYGGSGASGGFHTGWIGGGGSSYISGHTGCVAITSETNQSPKSGCTTGTSDLNCSIHYSSYQFQNTMMIDGIGYMWSNVKGEQQAMPNPERGVYPIGSGHTGNGVAKITLLYS